MQAQRASAYVNASLVACEIGLAITGCEFRLVRGNCCGCIIKTNKYASLLIEDRP